MAFFVVAAAVVAVEATYLKALLCVFDFYCKNTAAFCAFCQNNKIALHI